MPIDSLDFFPPLINSANPWATTEEDLRALFKCSHTGAVTTRTCTVNGFKHNDYLHQYCYLNSNDHKIEPKGDNHVQDTAVGPSKFCSSLNTLGYSPFSSKDYLEMISSICNSEENPTYKPFILSVTGTPVEISSIYISVLSLECPSRVLIEINLSCPNIAGKPPPAYSPSALLPYLNEIKRLRNGYEELVDLEVGIKTPPYTHQKQFEELISCLLESTNSPWHGSAPSRIRCPITFITATNTLGSCLVLDHAHNPALKSATGTGIGGLAGSALHPLALGNVATLRRMLDVHDELKDIDIIGVGGVNDGASYERMRSVGAAAVGVGTALGVEGIGVFERIRNEVKHMDGFG